MIQLDDLEDTDIQIIDIEKKLQTDEKTEEKIDESFVQRAEYLLYPSSTVFERVKSYLSLTAHNYTVKHVISFNI